jgi:hypothetical protein
MRATSERRRAGKSGQVAPPLAPAKHRAVGSTYRLVEKVALHPDHEIPAERAKDLGLVTLQQISRAFGVAVSTTYNWTHQELVPFPEHKAHLEADYSYSRKQRLYSAAEVIEWAGKYRPAQWALVRKERR